MPPKAQQSRRGDAARAWPMLKVLALFGALGLATLLLMTVSLGRSLARADALLDELRRSEEQLAQVTRIDADYQRLRAAAARSDPKAGRLADAVEAELAAYRRSITAEGEALGRRAGARQAAEAKAADELSRLFAARRAELETGAAGADDRRFAGLIEAIVAAERGEARAALAEMQALRRAMAVLGVLAPATGLVLAAVAGWIMLTRMVRPLRVLEAATGQVGAGERAAPIQAAGFAELRSLAVAFNRMDAEIAAQREALSAANRGLEDEVAARTREIEQSREKLANLDRTRRLFYSRLSHELRTPVTVMRGEAETALRDPAASPERLREALEHIAANGGFLQRRLEDMLALSRAEDGRVLLEKTPVDLAEVMDRTAALAEPYVRSSGARFVADLDAERRPTVLGDASWLQQGLLAVVDNAAKFAAGEGEVRLRFTADRGRARISVSDSGPGVAAADLPFLFESYYQTEQGRLRGGSGLGLSIARWVVEEHGGAIAASSPAGEGLTIDIELPIAS